MRKIILVFLTFLILLTFFFGLFLGSILTPKKSFKQTTEITDTLAWTIQDLSKQGFKMINKSTEAKVGLSFLTFTDFLAIARHYEVKTIYYALDDYKRPYFWYPDPTGKDSGIFRWDSL